MKIAIIGAGYMAREHIRSFQGIDNVELTGIYSRTKKKAEELAAEYCIKYVCGSLTELFEKTHSDIVIVAVPVLKTKEIVLEALEYPWLQLIEKPVGRDVREAEEILSAVKLYNRRAFAGLNRRFYSSTKSVQEDLSSDHNPRIICVYDQEDPHATWEEFRPQELIDRWMYANSIHLIDYFRIFGRGEITSIIPGFKWNSDAPSFVSSQINFSSGDIGLYQAVWGAPGPWGVTITTKKKRWELRPLEQASYQMYGSRQVIPLQTHQIDIDFKAGLRAQAEELIKVFNGQNHSLVTLEDAFETMKVVEQIYQPVNL